MSEVLDAALSEASDAGLNVQAVLSAARVPELGASGSLVLLASTGRRLWSHVDRSLQVSRVVLPAYGARARART